MSTIETLVKRKLFETEEEAIHQLVSEYILRQISERQEEVSRFERKYGMPFKQFSEYLHQRSVMLAKEGLSDEHRQSLGHAIMQEEDDWLEWKVSKEMLESWLGLRSETEK